MVEYDRSSPAAAKESLNICIAGVGGAGSNVLDRIAIDRVVEAKLVTFQSDIRVLNRTNVSNRVQLGTELMRGVGAGGDPDLGREAALFSKNEIREALEGHDIVFISTGLGGGTGSGAAPVIAEIAKSAGAIVVVFATVPFSFEGRRRGVQAGEALERLSKSTDALILFDNNRMGELILPKEGIQKAFAQGDQLIAQSVRAVTSMVGAPGLVKLGLDDLTAALKVSEGRCLFGFGEAKGQNRGTEALKRALKSPLINSGELLAQAKNLLVHIVGGESLTLVEVEQVMKQLGRHVPDETQLLFGLSVEPKLGETVTVTLLSALSARELATARRVEVEEVAAPAPRAEQTQPVVKPVRQSAPAAVKTVAPVAAPAAVAPAIPLPSEDDLFVSAPVHAPVVAEVPPAPVAAPAPAPVVERFNPPPAPAVQAAPVVEVAPPPPPAPVAAEEVVYEAEINDEPEPAPEPPRAPTRDSARVRLLSVIHSDKTAPTIVAKAQPPIDEVEITQEHVPQVLAPVPETASVPLARTSVPAPQAEAKSVDLFASREPASARKTQPVEQPTLRLGTEERGGRFKDTEPSFAAQSNEDLDTPTWMRLRRSVRK